MNAGIKRPVVVMGILLAAAGYAATKEWEWQADALTVQPEQIFQD